MLYIKIKIIKKVKSELIIFEKEVGIIGIGKMGDTLLKGALKVIEKEKIIIYDINNPLLEERSKNYNIDKAMSNIDLVKKSKIIIIAVLPQVIDGVLKEISNDLDGEQIIISIAAGVSIQHINKYINKNMGIIRVMPNISALIGEGATVLSPNKYIHKDQLDYVKKWGCKFVIPMPKVEVL